jgi:hypothetical protein
MGVVTIYRLAESCLSLIEGGDPATASSLTFNEIKIACGNVINQLLKTEYYSVNVASNEVIPNGMCFGLYENIDVVSYNGKSKASLPIKPMKLPRNMGVWAIYPKYTEIGDYELDKEFVPLQMGQGSLVKSQSLINDLLGQVGYENFGMDIIFTKDIKTLYPDIKLAMRLAIMDISQYTDYEPLPILPEQEWQVIQEVYKLYSTQAIPDKLVDPTVDEQKGIPTPQQRAAQ